MYVENTIYSVVASTLTMSIETVTNTDTIIANHAEFTPSSENVNLCSKFSVIYNTFRLVRL